jgi:hypothetical protein
MYQHKSLTRSVVCRPLMLLGGSVQSKDTTTLVQTVFEWKENGDDDDDDDDGDDDDDSESNKDELGIAQSEPRSDKHRDCIVHARSS